MPPYRVTLVNNAGLTTERVIKASSAKEAARMATDDNYSPVEANFDWQGLFEGTLKPKEISELLRHMAEHQESGHELIEAMRLESETARTSRMRRVMKRMVQDLESGEPLEDCFRNAGAWPDEMPSMIDAAYKSGNHVQRLKMIADEYERRADQKRSSSQKLYIPLFILCTTSIACFASFAKSVPMMVKHIDPSLLPGGTKFGLNVSAWVMNNVIFTFFIFAALIFGFIIFKNRLFEKFLPIGVKIPLLQSYIRGKYFSPFFYNLGLVMSAGVHHIPALKNVSRQNEIIKNKVENYLFQMNQGVKLVDAISSDSLLGAEARSYLSLGESVGNVHDQCLRLGKLYSDQQQMAAERIVKFAIPVLMLIATMIVLYMIIYGWAEPYKLITNYKSYSGGIVK